MRRPERQEDRIIDPEGSCDEILVAIAGTKDDPGGWLRDVRERTGRGMRHQGDMICWLKDDGHLSISDIAMRNPNVTFANGNLRVYGQTLPETALRGLAGRRLSDVIDTGLPSDLVIATAHNTRKWLRLRIRNRRMAPGEMRERLRQ